MKIKVGNTDQLHVIKRAVALLDKSTIGSSILAQAVDDLNTIPTVLRIEPDIAIVLEDALIDFIDICETEDEILTAVQLVEVLNQEKY